MLLWSGFRSVAEAGTDLATSPIPWPPPDTFDLADLDEFEAAADEVGYLPIGLMADVFKKLLRGLTTSPFSMATRAMSRASDSLRGLSAVAAAGEVG